MRLETIVTPGKAHKHAHMALAVLLLAACGGNGESPTGPGNGVGGGETSNQIIYSRSRNSAGDVSPVLSEGAGFDGAEVDSPCVVSDGSRVGGDKFMLFYEAQSTGGESTIGLVTSGEEDFAPLTITRTQVLGLGSAGSLYERGATDPSVLVDKRPEESTRRYKMWFEGRSGTNARTSTILFATSSDGLTWSDLTPCTGLDPSFGSVRVADPSVLLDGVAYKMWFEAIDSAGGSGADGPGVIGYAESADGVSWTVRDAAGNTGAAATFVFGTASSPRFDAYSVNAPCVVIDESVAPGSDERFKLWYEAGDISGSTENTIGYATSRDGLTWSRASLPVLAPSSDSRIPLPFDSGDLEHPTALLDLSLPAASDGHFLLWYTGDGESGASPNRIGLATGRAGP